MRIYWHGIQNWALKKKFYTYTVGFKKADILHYGLTKSKKETVANLAYKRMDWFTGLFKEKIFLINYKEFKIDH